jgi:transmembrane sensor
LDNGTNLVLDKTSNRKIAEQGNTIKVKKDGLLAYNADSKQPPKGVFYNTLAAAMVEYYSSLVLADGSKVWLNSLSSIRFPLHYWQREGSRGDR